MYIDEILFSKLTESLEENSFLQNNLLLLFVSLKQKLTKKLINYTSKEFNQLKL